MYYWLNIHYWLPITYSRWILLTLVHPNECFLTEWPVVLNGIPNYILQNKICIIKCCSIKFPYCFSNICLGSPLLTHWGRVTLICIIELTIIGSDNGLSPGWRQAIIWTNAGILLIGPLGTNFSDILIRVKKISFKKMHLKMSSAKWRPFVSASMC